MNRESVSTEELASLMIHRKYIDSCEASDITDTSVYKSFDMTTAEAYTSEELYCTSTSFKSTKELYGGEPPVGFMEGVDYISPEFLRDDLVKIKAKALVAETSKAFLVELTLSRKKAKGYNPTIEVWFPKGVCKNFRLDSITFYCWDVFFNKLQLNAYRELIQ